MLLSKKLKGSFLTIFQQPSIHQQIFWGWNLRHRNSTAKSDADAKWKKDKKIFTSEEISIILQTSFAANGTKSKPVLLLATNVDCMSGVSNKMRQTEGSPTKTSVSCRNIIKLYNNGKGGVDIIDQKTAAYRLDRKSKYVDNVFWSHRYRTCKQSCCLRETW